MYITTQVAYDAKDPLNRTIQESAIEETLKLRKLVSNNGRKSDDYRANCATVILEIQGENETHLVKYSSFSQGRKNLHAERRALIFALKKAVKDQLIENCGEIVEGAAINSLEDYKPQLSKNNLVQIENGEVPKIKIYIFTERKPCEGDDGCEAYLQEVLGESDCQIFYSIPFSEERYDDDCKFMDLMLQSVLPSAYDSLRPLNDPSRSLPPPLLTTPITLEDIEIYEKKPRVKLNYFLRMKQTQRERERGEEESRPLSSQGGGAAAQPPENAAARPSTEISSRKLSERFSRVGGASEEAMQQYASEIGEDDLPAASTVDRRGHEERDVALRRSPSPLVFSQNAQLTINPEAPGDKQADPQEHGESRKRTSSPEGSPPEGSAAAKSAPAAAPVKGIKRDRSSSEETKAGASDDESKKRSRLK